MVLHNITAGSITCCTILHCEEPNSSLQDLKDVRDYITDCHDRISSLQVKLGETNNYNLVRTIYIVRYLWWVS